MKIRHDKTSAYNPQANGLCERFHDTLKTSLSLVINEGKNDWDSFVPDIIAAYRTTLHSVTKETTCFLMFGRQFRVSPSVEFQPPTCLYTEDFVSERNNSLRQAYAIVRDLNRKERERGIRLRMIRGIMLGVQSLILVILSILRPAIVKRA